MRSCDSDSKISHGSARIFQGRAFEVQLAAVAQLRHLAHGGRQPASAVVRDAGIELQVTRFEQKVEHVFLRDGIANLHR